MIQGLRSGPYEEWLYYRGKEFHAHVGICRQCRENPFDLCSTGEEILLKREPPLNQEKR